MSKRFINTVVIIIIVLTICLVTFSITYAAFLMTQDTGVISNSAKGGKLDIVYTNGQDISGKLLAYPDNSKALSTTATIRKNSASVDAKANVTLHITTISSVLATTAFKWEVYVNSASSPAYTGNFNGKSNGGTIDVVSNYVLTTTDTVFTVKLWIDSNLNSNSISGATFSGYIDANAVNIAASTG